MPLISQTSDLRSYKQPYVSNMDRRGGGSSNQPYQTKVMEIPNDNQTSNDSNKLRLGLTGGPDILNRGGLNAFRRAGIDTARLAQYFFDFKSRGPLFIVKQNILSRASVKTESSIGVGYGGGFVNQGIYTPLSTLGQTIAGVAGTHLNFLGVDPTSPMSGVLSTGLSSAGLNRYEVVARDNDKEGKNRLVNLFLSKQFKKDDDPNLITYSGGPGSILGIGETKIQFADQRTGVNNTSPLGVKGSDRGNSTYSFRQIPSYYDTEDGFGDPGKVGRIQNFRILQGGAYDEYLINTDPNGNSLEDFVEAGGEEQAKIGVNEDGDILFNASAYETTYEFINNGDLLTPRSDTKTYLVGKNIESYDTEKFISPLGASSIFQDVTGESVKNQLNSGSDANPSAVVTWGRDYNSSVYAPGSIVDGSYKPTLKDRIGLKQYLTPFNQQVSLNTGPSLASNNPTIIDYTRVIGGGVSSRYAEIAIKDDADNFNERFNGIGNGGEKVGLNNYSVYLPGTLDSSVLVEDRAAQSGLRNAYVFSQEDYINYLSDENGDSNLNGRYKRVNPNPQDFRKEIIKKEEELGDGIENNELSPARRILSISPDYKTKSRRTRVGAGDPGFRNKSDGTKDVFNYGIPAHQLHKDENLVDRLTALPAYESANVQRKNSINDLCKFRICVLSNDDPSRNVYLHFRAFLDSMSDAYNASWNPIQYVGRGDNFYNYTGFTRSINMGFTVFAQSKAELVPMYTKLNYLASSLAPDYTSAGLMRGNMIRMTVGGYLYECPGFITSLNYDVINEAPWEISINEKGGADSSVKELPHMIKVSGLTFTPLHDFLVRKPQNTQVPDQRYISLTSRRNGAGLYGNSYKQLKARTPAKDDRNFITGES